ncbi:type III polyketide synthase [Saccharopolyspora sp. CA-218241]|uniref:type III polyketide synthase n=1 Tax=Saccharopolyspora sp. CA-218241 TaxID=3240027 RepID=UPI003D98D81C
MIAGIGTAFPAAVAQDVLWEGFFRDHFGGSRVAERIFRAPFLRRRHAAVNPVLEDVSGWSTGRRMRRYAEEAPPLGHRAITAALADAGLDAADIGLLAVVSCTGYSTPGLDVRLAESLALPDRVQRLCIGHMGCYAAVPGLGAVGDFTAARDRPAVLLCEELTSLHLQPPTSDPEQIVPHALFGDAAVALVVRPGGRGLELLDVDARTDTSASAYMTWDITDLGFRMGLSPKVPDVLADHVTEVTADLLGRNGYGPDDVRAWAVHPGGPRILDAVREALGLAPEALDASWSVLAEHGNCSSATLPLVVDELRRGGALDGGGPVVAMAFGPGLTLYAALLRAG